ncbi:hypothetical protein H4P1_00042 (plasmid) [Variovorax sp. PBS-H4]|uniref:AbiTii domain-containing protein n=1 Tax=Variovorax sp. PBS-H4 TaxID=434008 RepID=UPI0013190063|nr:hypothetical protein [Variovorax sp. PBS-H4]VTU41410.1 hypothetical protein H4P1_00042 [Variovorax sp. PBS-H4]
MGKQEDALALAGALLSEIELQQLEPVAVVLKASRLARLVGHDDLSTFTRFERGGYPPNTSWARFAKLAGREGTEAGKYYTVPLSRVESLATGADSAIQALAGGRQFGGDYSAIASREHDNKINGHSSNLATFRAISTQVVAVIYDMVADIYHELLFSNLQASLFSETQNLVDGTLAESSGSSLAKIESVSARLRDGDEESISQALTTCRRLIDSAADFLFTAREEAYNIGDGATLAVGKPQVLNRLQAFTHSANASKSRRDRLRVTLRELYSRCSAGTHDSVNAQEARFVFLQTYIVLGEVLTLKSANSIPDAVELRENGTDDQSADTVE